MGFHGFKRELYAKKDKFNLVLYFAEVKTVLNSRILKNDPFSQNSWGDLTNYEDVLT